MSLIFQRRVTAAAPGFGVAMHPDGNYVAVPHPSPAGAGVSVWEWSPGGWGAEVVDDSSAAGTNAFSVAWSPDGAYLALAHSGSPFVTVYAWDGSTLTAVSDPATLPPTQANTVAFSPGGGQIVAGGPSGAWLWSWSWSAGWGAFLNSAPSLPGTPFDLDFSPSGSHVACAHGSAPSVSAWAFSAAGFGAKVANPASPPSSLGGGGQHIHYSPDGNYLAVTNAVSPWINVYNWSAGFGSKLADPATLPELGNGVRFSPGGTHIVSAADVNLDGADRNILAWEWSAGFGSLVAHPDAQPGFPVRDIDFSPQGNVIAITESSAGPTLTGYIVGGGVQIEHRIIN